jgi:hypothetical protein
MRRLTLEEKLERFDPAIHGGELMADSSELVVLMPLWERIARRVLGLFYLLLLIPITLIFWITSVAMSSSAPDRTAPLIVGGLGAVLVLLPVALSSCVGLYIRVNSWLLFISFLISLAAIVAAGWQSPGSSVFWLYFLSFWMLSAYINSKNKLKATK